MTDVAGSSNGIALATAASPSVPAATSSPVLVLTIGRSVFNTLVATAEREGIDVNSLGVALLMLGLGRQTAYVAARRKHVTADDVPHAVRVVCVNCGRPRLEPNQGCCVTCGGGWCTSFG